MKTFYPACKRPTSPLPAIPFNFGTKFIEMAEEARSKPHVFYSTEVSIETAACDWILYVDRRLLCLFGRLDALSIFIFIF